MDLDAKGLSCEGECETETERQSIEKLEGAEMEGEELKEESMCKKVVQKRREKD